jgi:uncharacterized protein (TIGR03086 family)
MPETSAETFELIDQGLSAFGAKVHAVPAPAWSQPSPCTAWSVRDVVNHVVGEQLWVSHLLDGETIAQVGDRYDGDVTGDAPAEAWDAASLAAGTAWRKGSPDQIVHLSFGDVPALEYAEQMLVDLVVHGWDLARGAGLPDTIEPKAAEHVLGYLELHADDWRSGGAFDKAVDAASDDPAVRLLALAGRRA